MAEFSSASGISRPTLSRFFADPTSVRATSRQKIEDAMERLSYRPNLLAMNFNRRKPRTLGLLIPVILDPFYAGIVQRIELLARQAGYWTIVQNAHGDPAGEANAVTTLMALKVAAVIAVPLGDDSRRREFVSLVGAVPTVFLDTRIDVAGMHIGTDNRQSIGLLTDYLLRSGTPPVYFDMPEVNDNARARREAYRSTMEDAGAEPVIVPIEERGWDFERLAFDAATRLFSSRSPLPDTIACANDRIAFGVMAAACQAGLAIGRGKGAIRIAGHDDHPLSRYACPSLTTIAQDHDRLARAAFECALAAIDGPAGVAADHRLDGVLVMRDSA